MSNDDFVRYMEGLQDSRNIVADPSRSVSMATYDVPSKSKSTAMNSAHPVLCCVEALYPVVLGHLLQLHVIESHTSQCTWHLT